MMEAAAEASAKAAEEVMRGPNSVRLLSASGAAGHPAGAGGRLFDWRWHDRHKLVILAQRCAESRDEVVAARMVAAIMRRMPSSYAPGSVLRLRNGN